ncbi:MAG TPA: thiaminase II [Rhodobacteraceae bacterium]|jgi:thiaminase/transcriptional activator TenA|nr:thiaminase II [Paracoccaceae bacterium]
MTFVAPDYGKAFGLLRDAAGQKDGGLWDAYTRHPFVEGLRDGSLPQASYLHYLAQDYLFLVHFSRAWALAVVKSETRDEMKHASATVNALVNFETQHHVEVCAAHGIDEATLFNAEERPENMAYTRYVLDAGLSGDLADLMVSLVSCVLGYGEIGMRLAQETVADNPYAEWIETYAGDEFQDVCKTAGSMLDQALTRRIGADYAASPRWQRLSDRFIATTRLEKGFWDMGLQP